MNHDFENEVTLSDSVNKTCVKRPLAKKSRWRHFQLAIKPRYLGNHASQIHSYYGTLSGVHARSSRNRLKRWVKHTLAENSWCVGVIEKSNLENNICIRMFHTITITVLNTASLLETIFSYHFSHSTCTTPSTCILKSSIKWFRWVATIGTARQ